MTLSKKVKKELECLSIKRRLRKLDSENLNESKDVLNLLDMYQDAKDDLLLLQIVS